MQDAHRWLWAAQTATRRPPNVVENDCGRSVRQGDVDGLVAAIEGYAGDPAGREAAGDRARKALVDEHGARHRLAAWRSLLERVVSEGRPSPEGGSRA